VLETIHAVLEGLFPETIAMFLHETSARLEGLQNALVQQDLQTVLPIAHIVKGSSGNLGALRLSALCQLLMRVSASGVLADTTLQVVQIATEFSRIRTALEPLCHVGAIETTTAHVQ
jgi:HPt (histidine-containing phosphotransfer) domain-containing protein